ncbi:hypothetical protein [Streptomyces tsukubensis]|nr:hypothetical protein [Streptomyces tsukubensis]
MGRVSCVTLAKCARRAALEARFPGLLPSSLLTPVAESAGGHTTPGAEGP